MSYYKDEVMRALKRCEDAAVERAFKGTHPPELHAEIEAEYRKQRTKFRAALRSLVQEVRLNA